jgi:RNA polymerase sigma-70 factor, ECF subfamily
MGSRGVPSGMDSLDLSGGLEIPPASDDTRGVQRVLPWIDPQPPSGASPSGRHGAVSVEAARSSEARVSEPRDKRAEISSEGAEARALLCAAAAGDEAASRRIYRENVDRIYRTVARILGANDGDLDDVVQQTFLAALDSAARFDGRSKLSTYLIGIASRRALDAARERQRRARWGRLPEWVQDLLPARQGAPSDLEERGFAVWALGHLSPEQRQAFVLHEVEGHTLQEISDMTGTGISTLHARLTSAKKRLDAVVRPALLGEQKIDGGQR